MEPAFIINEASSNEVKQGAIGNCWFIGALSVVATNDKLILGGSNLVNIEKSHKVNAEVSNLLS